MRFFVALIVSVLLAEHAHALTCRLDQESTGAEGTVLVGLDAANVPNAVTIKLVKPVPYEARLDQLEISPPIAVHDGEAKTVGYRFHFIPLPDIGGVAKPKVVNLAMSIPVQPDAFARGSVYLHTPDQRLFHGLVRCEQAK